MLKLNEKMFEVGLMVGLVRMGVVNRLMDAGCGELFECVDVDVRFLGGRGYVVVGLREMFGEERLIEWFVRCDVGLEWEDVLRFVGLIVGECVCREWCVVLCDGVCDVWVGRGKFVDVVVDESGGE